MTLEKFQQNGLRTPRLNLRKLMLNDAQDMFEFTSFSANSRFLTWNVHENVEEDMDFIKNVIEKYEKAEELQFGIELKNKIIGTIRIYNIDFYNNEAEVSCILNQNFSGHGYMYETYKTLFESLNKEFGINKIIHCVDINNISSYNLIKKFHVTMESREKYHVKGRESTLARVTINIQGELIK